MTVCVRVSPDREKQKGNEFFKAGELEAATACYTRSIEYDGTNAVIWANRAMSYLKAGTSTNPSLLQTLPSYHTLSNAPYITHAL